MTVIQAILAFTCFCFTGSWVLQSLFIIRTGVGSISPGHTIISSAALAAFLYSIVGTQ